jgi:hypothetical protein
MCDGVARESGKPLSLVNYLKKSDENQCLIKTASMVCILAMSWLGTPVPQ